MFLKTVSIIPFVRSRKVRGMDHVTREICTQNLDGKPERNRALETQE